MIPDVADVQEVVGGKRVLTSSHPLLYVGGFSVVVNDSGTKPYVLQSSRRIACGQPFRGQCGTTGRENARSSLTVSACIPAEGRCRIQTVVLSRVPRCLL